MDKASRPTFDKDAFAKWRKDHAGDEDKKPAEEFFKRQAGTAEASAKRKRQPEVGAE